jgi:hypothetical protein
VPIVVVSTETSPEAAASTYPRHPSGAVLLALVVTLCLSSVLVLAS